MNKRHLKNGRTEDRTERKKERKKERKEIIMRMKRKKEGIGRIILDIFLVSAEMALELFLFCLHVSVNYELPLRERDFCFNGIFLRRHLSFCSL